MRNECLCLWEGVRVKRVTPSPPPCVHRPKTFLVGAAPSAAPSADAIVSRAGGPYDGATTVMLPFMPRSRWTPQ